MLQSEVEGLNRTFEKTHQWLLELSELDGLSSEKEAYAALRAVLQTLRDRLTVDEAAHLGAQLPTLVRGIFYESWRPAVPPTKERTQQEFLDSVARRIENPGLPVEQVCRSVFTLLERKVTSGEIEDVRHMLPSEVEKLWP